MTRGLARWAIRAARGEPKPIRRAFGVARGEPKPIRRAFGVARGEPKPIRRAFASPSWLRSLVHSRFRPPGCARLQGRLIRPGLTPRLRCEERPVRRRSGDLRPVRNLGFLTGRLSLRRPGWLRRREASPPQERRPAAGERASGTGLRVPEAPRQSRGRFAARGPVPLAGVSPGRRFRMEAGGSSGRRREAARLSLMRCGIC